MSEPADPNCLFCKIVAGEIPSQRVYESDTILAFKDIHPQAPFHCLVIPKVHRATLMDFAEHEREPRGVIVVRCAGDRRGAGASRIQSRDERGA